MGDEKNVDGSNERDETKRKGRSKTKDASKKNVLFVVMNVTQ